MPKISPFPYNVRFVNKRVVDMRRSYRHTLLEHPCKITASTAVRQSPPLHLPVWTLTTSFGQTSAHKFSCCAPLVCFQSFEAMSVPVYVQASSTDAEAPSNSPLDSPSKITSHDISWSNVSFSVGDKKILTDCWGNVRF